MVREGEWVSRWRCQSRRDYTDQSNERMEWQACNCRRETLSVWDTVGGRGSNPFFVWEFRNIHVRACCRRGKKITQVVMPFPEGTRISFRYSSALAALPITWRLNIVDGYDLSRTSVAMLWSIDVPLTEYRMPWDIFNCSNPWYVERSWR